MKAASPLYAVVDREGREWLWAGSPSLAREVGAQAFGAQWREMERAGYSVAVSTIEPVVDGDLARRVAAQLRNRTPAQVRADRLYALRWHAAPLILSALAAVLFAAWAVVTGIRN